MRQMPVVILVGGRGTRIAIGGVNKPKCLLTIGGKPIVSHVMDIYAAHGFTDFILAAGFKWRRIAQHFDEFPSAYDVEIVDTGPETQTGGRIKQVDLSGPFMCTYGDGVGDIDITQLIAFHKAHGKLATVTAVRPPARFGAMELGPEYVYDSSKRWGASVRAFNEKPQAEGGWISGGFFVFEPGVLDYIAGDQTMLEHEPLANLAKDGQLMAYLHDGYWQPMDTMRERDLLEELWASGQAPWAKR